MNKYCVVIEGPETTYYWQGKEILRYSDLRLILSTGGFPLRKVAKHWNALCTQLGFGVFTYWVRSCWVVDFRFNAALVERVVIESPFVNLLRRSKLDFSYLTPPQELDYAYPTRPQPEANV